MPVKYIEAVFFPSPLSVRQRSGVGAQSGPRQRLPQSQTGIHGEESRGAERCCGGAEG